MNALDQALRSALNGRYPALQRIHLTDYKVRILDGVAGTAAKTRVLIEGARDEERWSTIGVSTHSIVASR